MEESGQCAKVLWQTLNEARPQFEIRSLRGSKMVSGNSGSDKGENLRREDNKCQQEGQRCQPDESGHQLGAAGRVLFTSVI